MFKSKKLIRNMLAVCAIMFMSAVLCGAGCSNVAGSSGGGSSSGSGGSSSGSGGGSSSGGGSGWSAASIGINMVSIRGGTVPMSASYTPTVSNFSMGETEITQKQYQEILDWAKGDSAVKAKYSDITKANSSPSGFNGSSGKEADSGENQENRPVEMVSWYDAVMYCNLLTMKELGESECAYNITNITYAGNSNSYISSATVSEVTGKKGYRLPTEAEWEYMAKGGENHTYSGSNTIGDVAWYSDNSGNKTHEVKGKNPNKYGMYDMSGNVYEWCWDWNAPYSSSSPSDPHGPSSGSVRIYRGGGWGSLAAYCAVSSRNGGTPDYRNSNVGFRVVRGN